MKSWHIFFFLLLCGWGELFAQTTFAYPLQPFTRIHYYKLKAGFERPQPNNGVLLSKEQALTLLEILNDTASFELPQFRCFDPYDEFAFYNEDNKRVAKIEVGFKCQKIVAEPFVPYTQNIKIGLTQEAAARFKAFVAEVSQNLVPAVPEEITMLRHLVKAGETWESIAEKYETTPDMIATLNNKNLMWTPTTDEALEVPLQYQFFSYPPLEAYWMNLGIVESPPTPPPADVPAPKLEKLPAEIKAPSTPKDPIMVKTEIPKSETPVVATPPAYQSADVWHEVKKGETLFSICRIYKKTVASVQQANNLKDNQIRIGQKLKIPKD